MNPGSKIFYDRDEGELYIGKIGRWSLAIRLPRVKLYRKRTHPSQLAISPSTGDPTHAD